MNLSSEIVTKLVANYNKTMEETKAVRPVPDHIPVVRVMASHANGNADNLYISEFDRWTESYFILFHTVDGVYTEWITRNDLLDQYRFFVIDKEFVPDKTMMQYYNELR